MKIIHTADWHLGRQFHHVSLLEDQKFVLDQLIGHVTDSKADVVVVAGDVFDRSVPPADAVALLDETIYHLNVEAGAAVVLIAGNHDGAVRLALGSRLMESARVYIAGPLRKSLEPIVIEDEHGPVYFCNLPYADPAEVRIAFGDESIRSHDDAVRAMVLQVRSHLPDGVRSVAIGHCWAAGGSETESERPLSVGGTGEVDAACFEGFQYTALGHLHRPQRVNDRVVYSGSLLKYSFSEVDHNKSVSLVELDAQGNVTMDRLVLTPQLDLRILEGNLEEILEGPEDGENADDYLLVRLVDTGAILDAMGQLRAVYPNTLHIERPGLQINEGDLAPARDHRKRSELDLFKDFYRQFRDEDLDEEQEAVMVDVIGDVRANDRERQS